MGAEEPPPGQGQAGFDRHPGGDGLRQHGFLVVGVLFGEPVQAGHGDDAGGDAFLFQAFGSRNGELHFGAGAQQNHIRDGFRPGDQHVGTTGHPFGGVFFGAGQDRQVLAAERQPLGGFGVEQGGPPGGGGFIGVSRPDD